MFSPKELISFVFANENETYYCEDLLELDLNQYLWKTLHNQYETVYFLSASGNSFQIHTYGDLTAVKPDISGKPRLFGFIGSSEQEKLESWMLKQLRARPDRAVAFVCSMEDFCRVLSHDQWKDFLAALSAETKRSGIFVLTAPPTAEETRDLLLSSPVFERLRETAVTDLRGGELRDLYGPLRRSKWDSCLFLNSFTRERVQGLLLNIAMRHTDRMVGMQKLEQMTDYLMAYLNDPELHRQEPLLSRNIPTEYYSYRELYDQLSESDTWSRLKLQSSQYAQSAQGMRSRSVRCETPVLRDRKCYAGKCRMLQLPQWARKKDTESLRLGKLLESIHSEVAVPKNRKENPKIVAAAEYFLCQFDILLPDDVETCRELLRAVEFCVQRVYATDSECARILDVVDKLREGIKISANCFTMQRDLQISTLHGSSGELFNHHLNQMKNKLKGMESIRKQYSDLINASILELNMPQTASKTMELLEEVAQKLQHYEESESAEPEPAVEEKTEAPVSHEDIFGDDFHFRTEDYGYIPPTLNN